MNGVRHQRAHLLQGLIQKLELFFERTQASLLEINQLRTDLGYPNRPVM